MFAATLGACSIFRALVHVSSAGGGRGSVAVGLVDMLEELTLGRGSGVDKEGVHTENLGESEDV